jgi:hypothetical protein
VTVEYPPEFADVNGSGNEPQLLCGVALGRVPGEACYEWRRPNDAVASKTLSVMRLAGEVAFSLCDAARHEAL